MRSEKEQHPDGHEQFHPQMRIEKEQHPDRQEQFHPRPHSGGERFDGHEQFRPHQRVGPDLDDYEEFHTHPHGGQDRKPRNTGRGARAGRDKATGNTERQSQRQSQRHSDLFDSDYSFDDVRSDYGAGSSLSGEKNRNDGYTEVFGRKYRHGQNMCPGRDQNGAPQSRHSLDRDSEFGRRDRHRNQHSSSPKYGHLVLHRRDNLGSVDSNSDCLDSDSSKRSIFRHNHRRNSSSYSPLDEHGDMASSNGYISPKKGSGDYSEDDRFGRFHNRTPSIRTGAAGWAAGQQRPVTRGSKPTPSRRNHPVQLHGVRDKADIIAAELAQKKHRREMEKQEMGIWGLLTDLNRDRAREKTIRNERDRTKGKKSAHTGSVPRSTWNEFGDHCYHGL